MEKRKQNPLSEQTDFAKKSKIPRMYISLAFAVKKKTLLGMIYLTWVQN